MYYEHYKRRLREQEGEGHHQLSTHTRQLLRAKVRQQRSFSNRSFDSYSSCNSSMSSSESVSSPQKSSPAEPQPSNSNSQPQKKLLVLISNGLVDRTQSSNQSSALAVLNARGTPYATLDGMDPSNRDRRNELFGISGIRGNYPQLFLISQEGEAEYWGNYDRLEAANESSSIPSDVLEAHPEIETWDGAFGNVVGEFR